MAQNWGENDKIVNVGSADFGADDEVVQDGALSRGWNNTKKSIAMTAQLATGDTAGAAQTVKEAAEYARANPGSKEGAALSEAWGKGDGVSGGIGNVIEKIGSDYSEAKGFVSGLKSVGRNVKALGANIVGQVPNMAAPTIGLVGGSVAGGAAGSAVPIIGNFVGAKMGGWAGASAGNALVEGGEQIQTAIQKAGINPSDTKAVQAYLDQNSGELLKNTAIKGSVIGALDTATGGAAHLLLSAPGKAAAGRALGKMGVDIADKAAVKAAQQSGEFARLIAADTAYQASKKGAGNVARNVVAAGLDPAGEFAGEYLGSGLANDNWDTKGAALEALSSIGQSGAMFAGQKAWQYAASPKSSEAGAPASDAPTEPQAAPQTESQTGPIPSGDPNVIIVDPQGNASTAEDRNTQTQPGPGVTPSDSAVAPAPERQTESQAMGLDPNAGALSAAAAIAVDSGAHAQTLDAEAQQVGGEALQREAGAAAKTGATAPQAGAQTGQHAAGAPDQRASGASAVSLSDRAGELRSQLGALTQQAELTGWDKGLVDQRAQISSELSAIRKQIKSGDLPAGQPTSLREGIAQTQARHAASIPVAPAGNAPTQQATQAIPHAQVAATQAQPLATAVQAAGPVALNRADEIQARLDFIQQHARANGWNKQMVAERAKLSNELATLQTQERTNDDRTTAAAVRVGNEPGTGSVPASHDTASPPAGHQEDSARPERSGKPVGAEPSQSADAHSEQGIPASSGVPHAKPELGTDIKTVVAKQIPQMSDTELQQAIDYYGPNHKRTPKLHKELSKRGVEPSVQTAGVTNGAQTLEAQQASPQPAQAGGAPAEASASSLANGLVKVRTAKGATVHVRQSDLDGNTETLPTFTEAGKPRAVKASRKNLVLPGVSAVTPDAAGQEVKAGQSTKSNHGQEIKPLQIKASGEPAAEKAASDQESDVSAGSVDAIAVELRDQLADDLADKRRKHMADYAKKRLTSNFTETQAAENAPLPPTDVRIGDKVIVNGESHTVTGPLKDGRKVVGVVASRDSDTDPLKGVRQVLLKGDDAIRAKIAADDARRAEEQGKQPRGVLAKKAATEKKKAAESNDRQITEASGSKPSGESDAETAAPNQIGPAPGRFSGNTRPTAAEPVAPKTERERQHATQPDARELKAGPVERGRVEPQSATAPEKAPAQAVDSSEINPGTVSDRFAENKIFTADKVAAARERMKKKLGTLNSGIDPELMMDGMTIAGAYIESGVRNFTQYAKAMIEDMGDGVKPYLLSFWEAARNYPGVQNADMTSVEESARHHSVLMTPVADPAKKPRDAAENKAMVDHFSDQLAKGNMPKDNNALKKMVAEFDGKQPDPARMKQAQEDLEAAIVVESRRQVMATEGDRATFDSLVKLYASQPNLNVRTSSSIENQAYSTPAPLAYVAGRLAGVDQHSAVYEPTAGNGMLLITADPKNATANEMDDRRYANLLAQGYDAIQGDALEAIESGAVLEKSQDAVVTNPPFGSVKDQGGKATKVDIDGYKIGKIDHLIAADSLRAIKDDGKAVLILGADKVAGGISKDDRIFFNWLYSHYNVTSHFEADGKLYARQGASWPVRVISINGRNESSQVSPKAGTVQRVSTWEQVYEQFQQGLVSQNQRPERDTAGGADGAVQRGSSDNESVAAEGSSVRKAVQRGEGRPAVGTVGAGDVVGTSPRASGNSADRAAERLAIADSGKRRDGATTGADRLAAGEQGRDADQAAGSGKPARDAGASRVNVLASADNAYQSKYVPASGRKDEGVLIPVNMASPLRDALNAVEDEVGDIDAFAAKELGYKNTAELHNALMGLQVDSVATAIRNLKGGKGTIIADQTGIGKGRQAASIIRWAKNNGKVPVFITVKPQLFTDMYGDLADIGSTDINPLIINKDEHIAGPGGEKLFANGKDHRKVLQDVVATGQLPEGANAVFLTYSQINTNNTQRAVLNALADKAVFVLDESHNAGGASSTGEYVTDLLANASGVTYLSATYAKRPDNMPVYFRTDIGDAIADKDGLMSAMAAGGLPLQTVVSNNLVKAGQMFRRERSYDGVSIVTKTDTARTAEHEALSDEITGALRSIVSADKTFHSVFFETMKKNLEDSGESAYDVAGNQAGASVDHTEFSSVVHNFVRQFLLGLKADAAADEAIAALERGQKPLIALDNTMGSFLSEYAANSGLKAGDALGKFDYRTVLSRALERSRYIQKDDGLGYKTKEYIPLSELDSITRAAYDKAQDVIDSLDVGSIPVSPLDWIRNRLEKAGHSVAEITGRDLAVDYSGKNPKLASVPSGERADKVGTTRKFNDGRLDAIILNVSGSTGISLHASERFKDQRPRHMIVAQAAQDINIFMQMLGRVHRTGQVELPSYSILNVDLPAEKRPTAILSGKMKSLNANTSSNTESATSVKAVDMLNKYGDQVIGQYLADNFELASALGLYSPVNEKGEAEEGLARKATGRLALMPVEVQKQFYADVEDQYNELIDYLNKTNQNELEPRTLDFDAVETERQNLVAQSGDGPFNEAADYVELSIKPQGKPMTFEEIKATATENLSGKTPAAHATALFDGLDRQYQQFKSRLTTDAQMDAADSARRKSQEFIGGHPIGSMWRVEINGDMYNAVVINIKSGHKGNGNPHSLSKTSVQLAVNGSLRQVTVPATQFEKIEVAPLRGVRAEDALIVRNADEREKAKVITGNLLAAYGELRGVKGSIINFSRADGSVEQGILLPKSFDVANNTAGDYRMRSAADAVQFLRNSNAQDTAKYGVQSRDGVVRITPNGDGIRIQVPRSKARGGKFFLDQKIRDVTGDFVSTGSMMGVDVPSSKAEKAVDAVMKKTALYALPSMAEEAKAMLDGEATGGAGQAKETPNGIALHAINEGDPAQEEARRVQSAIEGKSLIDAARFMTQSSDKAKAAVAEKVLEKLERLEKSGVELSLNIVHRGDMAPADMAFSRGYTEAGFDEKGRDVSVWLNGADVTGKVGVDEETLLHELVHAATTGMVHYGATNPNSLAGKHARDLMAVTDAIAEHISERFKAAENGKAELTEFEQSMRDGRNNAFRNDDEVLAWALSSRDAQAYLETIPYKSETLWSRFVQAVRNLLGMSATNDTALSEVLRVAEHILTSDDPKTGRPAFWHKRGLNMVQQQGRGTVVHRSPVGNAQADGEVLGSASMPATIAVDGIERPTTNSKGQQIARTEEGVRNFWRWFGDSGVVDAEGRPLVVYHGTTKDFDVFEDLAYRQGYYFADDPEYANLFTEKFGSVMPAYLSAKNLADLRDGVSNEILFAVKGQGYSDVGSLMRYSPDEYWELFDGTSDLADALKAAGYDGVRLKEPKDDNGRNVDSWLVFRPEQVKSAIGNNGDFDPENANVLKSSSPEGIARSMFGNPNPKSTVEQITKELAGEIGSLGENIKVIQSALDLPPDERRQVFQSASGDRGLEGVFFPDTHHAYLIADNIEPGNAFATLMHEAGVHAGMRGLIGDEGVRKLAAQIKAWALLDHKTEAGDLARKAKNRIPGDTHKSDKDEELIAYFVTEAVRAGHGKVGQTGAIAEWFKKLWAHIRSAIEKLGADPSKLTTDDVVSLARGALERVANEKGKEVVRFRPNGHNSVGPTFKSLTGLWLDPAFEVNREEGDFDLGGFAEHGLMGHFLQAEPGSRTYGFGIFDPDGKNLGYLVGDVKDGRIVSVHDFEINNKRQGLGTKVIAGLSANGPLKIADILSQSEKFWARHGAERDWEGNGQAVWQRNGTSAQGNAGVRQGQGQGNRAVSGVQGADQRVQSGEEAISADDLKWLEENGLGKDDGLPMFASRRSAALFSRSTVPEYARTARDELNKTFNIPGKLSWWHKTIGTMYNLAERSPAFKKVFDAAQGFVDDVSHYATDAAELAPRLLPKLDTWRDIAKKPTSAADNSAISKPIFEGTLAWARDNQGKPIPIEEKIKQAEKFTADQKAKSLMLSGDLSERAYKLWRGMPLEIYERNISSMYESTFLQAGVVWSDDELKSMFHLNDAQIGLYHEFRSATDRSLDTMARSDMLRYAGKDAKPMRQAVMAAKDAQEASKLLRDYLDDLARKNPEREDHLISLQNGILDKANRVADLKERGYAPLSRFGKYKVYVEDKNGDSEYFGLFETVREANKMVEKMRKAYPEMKVSSGTMSEEEFKMFSGITPETLELFGNALGLDSTGDEARDKAFQEYLKLTKNNRSAMKRLIHRKGIAGYSEDVGRVLASFIYSNSRNTAAGLNIGDLGEAVMEIPREQGELKDAAFRLMDYVKNPQEEAQALRGLLFVQYLAGSIASAFVNMTQPIAVSFPYLSQFGGARQSASELARAAKDMASRTKFDSDLADALRDAEEDGTVSPQEIHQLQAQARGQSTLRSGDGTRMGDARVGAQNALSRLSLALGKVFGVSEQANRRITFIAAYRIAKQQGMSDPFAFAKKAVTETQFLYSKANKMEWGRGAIGGTLMTFKSYSIAYIELLHRMYTQGGPEGKKAALLALGVMMLMAGAGGLPFEDDLIDVADALAEKLGYNLSAKRARQEFLADVFGEGLGHFIDKGVTGLPGVPIDVSGRLGLGNLIPGTGLLKSKTDHTRDLAEFAGPAGDLLMRGFSGASKVLGGDVGGGLMEMAPLFARNIAKGADMASTGMYRDAKGYKVIDTDGFEAGAKTIGFQPSSVADIQEANAANQQAKNFYSLRAQEIRAKWASGIFKNDPDAIQSARDEITDWNEKNPDQPMIIKIPSVLKKVREMRKSKDQRIADTAPRAMRARMKTEILERAAGG